jgi:hypothetical protein
MNEQQVKDKLFELFLKWMRGQTVSQDENGQTNYYDGDVRIYIKAMSRLNPTPFD